MRLSRWLPFIPVLTPCCLQDLDHRGGGNNPGGLVTFQGKEFLVAGHEELGPAGFGRVKASLASTSGIHGPEDMVKLLMVAANVTMLCSTLMRNGLSNRGLALRSTLWRSFGADLRPRTRVRRVRRRQ
jgi:hypothetical protein